MVSDSTKNWMKVWTREAATESDRVVQKSTTSVMILRSDFLYETLT